MKKQLICLIILISNLINAQHCPYDGTSIIVIKIHTRENQNTIPNLKLSLVKKKKNKIVKILEDFPSQSYNFPFLADEYSIIIGNAFDIENWYLKIESVCAYTNNEYTTYGTTEIKLTENDKYPLCENYDSSEYNTIGFGEQRIYKPIEVILYQRNCEEINN
ncbi:hypothetical protein OX283_003530 [Flavobacterium sp. SUN052]|uniref:hypothetical protein n=1 Tax=Flavobacterium sp. SUN052 TaxID=3002441 RepID=UPI00237DA1DC|nr:hypothetical protein [Flavobacterium sp. SUN052]MEC4003714.1 hypothetical protein [Flavobacterium sp. SUN052]